MELLYIFAPAYGTGQVLTPNATSATATISGVSDNIVITNLGANVAYVRLANDVVAASTADYPIPAGAQVNLGKIRGVTNLRHISASGTTLHIIEGEGV